MNAHDWRLFDCDPLTQRKKYMKIDDGKLWIRETMPVDAILEQNRQEANVWKSTGGWSKRKLGAVVSRVPLILDNELKKLCGYNPCISGWYDQDKYRSFLDDIDYKHLRTGGGKLGKRKKIAAVNPAKLAKIIGAAP